MNTVDLGEVIVIAAAVLTVEPEALVPAVKIGAAESALQAGWE